MANMFYKTVKNRYRLSTMNYCQDISVQSGKSGTIRELNQASGVRKGHYA